jgi:CO/xanthine dehydrogenase FAD-binding subunit
MRTFEYIKAKSLQEACELLARHGVKAHLLAGGTDVVGKLKERELTPDVIVDVKGIPGLSGIQYRPGEGMKIGPLTPIREIETSPVIREHLPVLAYAAHLIGSVQIRHRATIGGNICNALPSADTGPYLIAMGAEATVMGASGERTMLVEDIFAASGKNSLSPGDIVTSIDIPAWPAMTGGAYVKHALKKAVDVAIVNVGVAVTTDPKKTTFEQVRIVIGSVGPRPIRAKAAEEYLKGKAIDDVVMATAGEMAAKAATPRTTKEYKTEMVKVLTRRMLKQSLEQITTKE